MLGAVLGLSLIAAASSPAVDAQPAAASLQGGGVALGSAYAQVAHAFPGARTLRMANGEPALEIADQGYGGARWSAVDFVFDGYGRLARVKLSTRALTFAQLKAELQVRYDTYMTAARRIGVSGPSDDDLQLRICDTGDGAVSLTYEKATTAL